jgi:uncharacterized DUF497 family protein
MRFVFDPAKDRRNRAERGIPLGRAAEMFDAPTIEFVDTRRDYGEIRIVAYGLIGSRVHCCVYTDRGDDRRIISLRKASAGESHDYFEALDLG